ncbi:MAG: cyanophycin synthetase, partial [Polyangiaceae bacterium]|nr:cyanophycin synthetase [Polyangiaceae bacterium]
ARVIARAFQRVVIREDADHRGRRPGEVARLLSEAIAADAPRTECAVVLDERAAVERALGEMIDDELHVVFYDDLGALTDLLAAWGAEPALEVAPATYQP